MKKRCMLSAVVLLVFLAFASSVFSVKDVAAQPDQAWSKLQAANAAFEQAFNAVLEAEQAGSNVTVLLSRLNVAADLLAQAEMAIRNGDAHAVADKADNAFQIALEVKTEAVNAEGAAVVAYQNALWLNSMLSVVGAAVFVLVLLFAWQRFKRRYVGKLRSAKPEVLSQ